MRKATVIFIAAVLLLSLLPVNALASSIYDTWVATDALGRELPDNAKAGDVKESKYVGIFYFLFANTQSGTILDHSRAYLDGGVEAVWEMIVQEGYHVWGQPYFGYYRSNDEWIIRKHAYMLCEAGIDFVFLDTTNDGGLFKENWMLICDTWLKMRQEGIDTPQIVFHNGDVDTTMVKHVDEIYKAIYSTDKYKDLWFMWDGKPLILGNAAKLSAEMKDFFTIRASWAYNAWTNSGRGKWPWIAETPQRPGKSEDGTLEQMAVAAGFHPNSSSGRSFVKGRQTSNGKNDFGFSLDTTDEGLAFAEQWTEAIKRDPSIVMLTGWNEFTMGKWPGAGPGQFNSGTYTIKPNDPQFENNYIDQFNVEYSRDIEPINGFYGDNYFYEMAYYIKLFKGTAKLPESAKGTDIEINGDTAAFDSLTSYEDSRGDIMHRNIMSVCSVYKYLNETGRNDIITSKVSKTDDYTYFYVKCAADITSAEGENWMNLFINSDSSYESGWEGYDFIVNRSRTSSTVSVERFVGGEWRFQTIGNADYSVSGDTMIIKIPSEMIKLSDHDDFNFKWADNSITSDNIMGFMDLGDAAPNDRYAFRYVMTGGKIGTSVLTDADFPPVETEPVTDNDTDSSTTDGETKGDTPDNSNEFVKYELAAYISAAVAFISIVICAVVYFKGGKKS